MKCDRCVPQSQWSQLLARAAARSSLKTVHWTVFRAFRTHGAYSLSIDLRSDEISATGGHRIFAQSTCGTLTAVAWQLYTAISMVVTPHSGDYSLSINLSSFEISATGSRKSFAQIKDLDNSSTIQNYLFVPEGVPLPLRCHPDRSGGIP